MKTESMTAPASPLSKLEARLNSTTSVPVVAFRVSELGLIDSNATVAKHAHTLAAPVSIPALKPTGERRVRISVFPAGTRSFRQPCQKHHCPRTLERAQIVAQRYVNQADNPRVVIHQGNLLKASYSVIWDSGKEPSYFDEITVEITAFPDFESLLKAEGGYFPTINVATHKGLTLANAYDAIQKQLGDPRRVNRVKIRKEAVK